MNEGAKRERSPWLDFRRKRFWAIVAIVVYTLAGFFLVPALVTHFGVKKIEEATGRNATIGDVRFNPYLLRLEVDGFEFDDDDGETLASFDGLLVDFQLSSLFRWALTFKTLQVDGPYLLYERFDADDSRLSRLLADIEKRTPEPPTEENDGDLPRLLIGTLAINDGRGLFLDNSTEEVVEIPAGPITVVIHELNTLPDRDGQQTVEIRLEQGAALRWQGDIELEPLTSEGSLTLEGLELGPFLPYLSASLPIDEFTGTLSARTAYQLSEDPELGIVARLEGLESSLDQLRLTGLQPASEFLAFDRLSVTGGTARYPEMELAIADVILSRPVLDAWLDADGQPGLLQLVPETAEAPAPGPDAEPRDTPRIEVARFRIEEGQVALSDRSLEPAASADLRNLALALEGIDNQDGTRMPLSLSFELGDTGTVAFDGNVAALPEVTAAGRFDMKTLPLSMAKAYVEQALTVSMRGGTMSTAADVELAADGTVRASGSLALDGFDVYDTRNEESLLAWNELAIDRWEFDSAASHLGISSLRFDQPYGRIRINEDRSTNLDGLVREPEPESASPEQEETDAFAISFLVGGIAVDDGSMDFADLSLPLPFATRIASLEGTISTVDSRSVEPADIRLEGQVDDYGLARIQGSMYLPDPVVSTDVSVEFRNLLMRNLSPYSAAFAGREIDEGKLDLDLEYVIDGGLLKGENAVVLSDLVLGAKVDAPDAVSLPLDLAVALLKNSEGVIDVQLPVEGDINNPEFRIGGVIWQAFTTLLTKVVTAPFRLLGNLVGIDSEDFGQFQFLAGRHDLTPPELERIAQLQEALTQRPELGLEIMGVFDPAVDGPALQYLQLRQTVFERLGRDPTEEGSAGEMLDEEIRSALEDLYRERFPDQPLEELKAAHTAPPAGDPEAKPVFDALAYAGDLGERLVASEPMGPEQLTALGRDRAQAVADAFLADGLDPARVVLADPEAVESEDGEWVVMELGVATP